MRRSFAWKNVSNWFSMCISSSFLFVDNDSIEERVRKCMEKNFLKGFEKDRKSTRLNSSHVSISYAVFCLKKKKIILDIISTHIIYSDPAPTQIYPLSLHDALPISMNLEMNAAFIRLEERFELVFHVYI